MTIGINDVVTGINTASLIGGKLLNAASTAENIYDYFNGDSNNINSFSKRGKIAVIEYNKFLETNDIKGDEAYKIHEEELADEYLTPKKENFYIWSYNEGYFHIEELEELGINISGLSPNDLKMKELAIKLYYGGANIPEGVDERFEEWKETNGFDYGKIIEAKENVKNKVEENLKNNTPANNIDYVAKVKNDDNDDKDLDAA